jgi:hypothetical protein
MTQSSYFWNGLSVGDSVLSPYGDETLALIDRLRFQPDPANQSVLGSNCLACDGLMASSAGVLTVDVAAGEAMVNGRYYQNSASKTLTMTLHPYSWWSVVLRSDSTLQTIRMAIKGPYASRYTAEHAVTQTRDIWEVTTAIVYQAITPTNCTCYDRRIRAIRQNYVYTFIPALTGYNMTHNINLTYRSDMGFLIPDGDSVYLGGQFTFSYDLWEYPIIQPILIPLGATISGANVYIRQVYFWGVYTEIYNVNSYDSGYAAHAIVDQTLNLPVSYAFSPIPDPDYGLITCLFYRDGTDVLDTYPGAVYFPGWRVEYLSRVK